MAWTAAVPEVKYTDIILYVLGSLALLVLLVLVGLYRGQMLRSRQPRQPATVQKLSRFPLARQVCPSLCVLAPEHQSLGVSIPGAPVPMPINNSVSDSSVLP